VILEAARRLSELERERDNCKREKEFAASDRSSCKKKHESRSTFLASSAATKRIGTNKQKPVFFSSLSLSFPVLDPSSDAREAVACSH